MTTTCETCGKPTDLDGAKLCNACWEVEHRLEDYLKSPNGQAFARKAMPLLDDWVDGQPDAWDYEAVLAANQVEVTWEHLTMDDAGVTEELPLEACGWGLSWTHGVIDIGQTSETVARKAAALFVSLWLRGVSASFCNALMDGFIIHLVRQEGGMFAALLYRHQGGELCFREGHHAAGGPKWFADHIDREVSAALDLQPDEEVIVTFTKRPKRV